jgi:hypothetical protein
MSKEKWAYYILVILLAVCALVIINIITILQLFWH